VSPQDLAVAASDLRSKCRTGQAREIERALNLLKATARPWVTGLKQRRHRLSVAAGWFSGTRAIMFFG
jgi:hypothetical protein